MHDEASPGSMRRLTEERPDPWHGYGTSRAAGEVETYFVP